MKQSMITLACGLLALQGCAHSTNKDLDVKASAESSVSTPAQLESEVSALIDADSGLNADQKRKLKELHAAHKTKVDALEQKSVELKSLLVKDVLAPEYNGGEVKDIKRRLHQIEDQRLSALFDAVDKANSIIGRSGSDRPRMMRAFMSPGSRSIRD